ncbi:hypothetical protein [Ponticaulis sp.]|uniref:hypothetical protein n=1 Tax=Ponticaulis sp. TaxID=2020902 RepID=UPI000B752913|nr:hypothetical protein [Ponticaulis sp.]MAI91051.1 hypothetical protein [Ponticaulis sp.]OUX98384.1 MAG: hypothetical protein CBB65_11440 [Hyphomonadaceae bacterium TMED5]
MLFIFVGIALCFAIWAGLIYWNYLGIKKEARIVYDAALSRAEFPADEPFEPFETAHLKTSVLRVSIYRWAACATAAIVLPLAVGFFSFVWVRLYYLTGATDVFSEGTLIHSFYLAVMTMGSLVLVAGLYARAYHKGRTHDFEVEWAKAKTPDPATLNA